MPYRKLFAFGGLLIGRPSRKARRQKIGLLFWNKSLSVECLCCNATARFHTKTRIKFILIGALKKTSLLL